VGPIQNLISDVGLNLLAIDDLTTHGNVVIFEPGKASIFNIASGKSLDLIHHDPLWQVRLQDIAQLPAAVTTNQSFVGETPDVIPTAASTSPESLINRILSYTGDPTDWRTLESKSSILMERFSITSTPL
jgi:hypothetical protein